MVLGCLELTSDLSVYGCTECHSEIASENGLSVDVRPRTALLDEHVLRHRTRAAPERRRAAADQTSGLLEKRA